jgi:hypothetical protein
MKMMKTQRKTTMRALRTPTKLSASESLWKERRIRLSSTSLDNPRKTELPAGLSLEQLQETTLPLLPPKKALKVFRVPKLFLEWIRFLMLTAQLPKYIKKGPRRKKRRNCESSSD